MIGSKKRVIQFTVAICLLMLAACNGQDQPSPTSPIDLTGTAEFEKPQETRDSSVENSRTPVKLESSETPTNEATKVTSVAITPSEAEATPLFHSPEYGIQTFMWWLPHIAERDIGLVQELGFNWVKQSFAWRDIETLEKGKYDWYRPDLIVDLIEQANLKLLVRIDRQPFWSQEFAEPLLQNSPPGDLQDFADFCFVLAERYKGRISAYQIWNEPNLSREWGNAPPDPVAYTELLKVCYESIKAADPDAIVISAGLAPTGTGLPIALPDTTFLQQMYDSGAAAYFDVLGLNAPGYKAPPEISPEEAASDPEYGAGRWFAFRHVEDMRDIMLANNDGNKQVAILELGWTTDQINPEYAWHAVSEQEQAAYLVRAYEYARDHWSPWIGPMFTIYIADFSWTAEENEQWWWAITLPDGSKRPAFSALKEMEKLSTTP